MATADADDTEDAPEAVESEAVVLDEVHDDLMWLEAIQELAGIEPPSDGRIYFSYHRMMVAAFDRATAILRGEPFPTKGEPDADPSA